MAQGRADELYVFNDTVTFIAGRHSAKAGGEFRLIEMSSYGDRAYLSYGFTPTQTGVQGGPLANQVGFGFASFLLGEVAAAVYGKPSERLRVIGVTGTSGKTTTTYLVEAGLRSAGRSVGLIGTVGTRIDGADSSMSETNRTAFAACEPAPYSAR